MSEKEAARSVYRLARFRANPGVVRVSIRQAGDRWIAFVAPRDVTAGLSFYYNSSDPKCAVLKALQLAQRKGMPGIDLDLQWAYDHPQKR